MCGFEEDFPGPSYCLWTVIVSNEMFSLHKMYSFNNCDNLDPNDQTNSSYPKNKS